MRAPVWPPAARNQPRLGGSWAGVKAPHPSLGYRLPLSLMRALEIADGDDSAHAKARCLNAA